MSWDISGIFENIETERFAMQGFDEDTAEASLRAIEVMHELVPTLPGHEDVAVIPTGSRIKGYATNQSDLDLLVISTEDFDTSKLRAAIDAVVFKETGVRTMHSPDGFIDPDDMLTSYVDVEGYINKALTQLRAATTSLALGGAAIIGQNLLEIDLSLDPDTADSAIFKGHLAGEYNELFVCAKDGHNLGERLIDSLLLRGHSLDVEFSDTTGPEPSRLTKFFYPNITDVSKCFDHSRHDHEQAAEYMIALAYATRLGRFGFEALA